MKKSSRIYFLFSFLSLCIQFIYGQPNEQELGYFNLDSPTNAEATEFLSLTDLKDFKSDLIQSSITFPKNPIHQIHLGIEDEATENNNILTLKREESWTNSTHPRGLQYTEVYKRLPENCALVGVGARVHDSNVISLEVKGVEIRDNGTLGRRLSWTEGLTNVGTEMYWEVPTGYLITGLGWNVRRNNVDNLVVWYRRYDPKSRTLVGAEEVKVVGRNRPINYTEVVLRNPKTPSKYDLNRFAITGIGLNCRRSNMDNLVLEYSRIIKP